MKTGGTPAGVHCQRERTRESRPGRQKVKKAMERIPGFRQVAQEVVDAYAQGRMLFFNGASGDMLSADRQFVLSFNVGNEYAAAQLVVERHATEADRKRAFGTVEQAAAVEASWDLDPARAARAIVAGLQDGRMLFFNGNQATLVSANGQWLIRVTLMGVRGQEIEYVPVEKSGQDPDLQRPLFADEDLARDLAGQNGIELPAKQPLTGQLLEDFYSLRKELKREQAHAIPKVGPTGVRGRGF